MTMSSRRAAAGTAASALVLGVLSVTATPASAQSAEAATGGTAAKRPLSTQLAKARGPVTVLVRTTGEAPVTVFARHRGSGLAAAAKAERSAAAASATRVAALRAQLAGKGHLLFSTTRVVPGVALRTDARNLAAIAKLPGVAAVQELTPKTRENARADEVTRALNTWTTASDTGAGVTVGVLDTGIDYTHVDFGGGGIDDFTSNDTTHIPSDGPAYAGDVPFPTAKVVGGKDFAGDDYTGFNDPAPDNDPQDCATAKGGGHGTHVAGTVAGFGVTGAGNTYNGPYAGLTPTDLAAMNVGPGAAPQATLVALRIFGCDGSTFLTSEALDYVAGLNTDDSTTNDVDILNLSLGSDFTRGDDPDAQAIDQLSDLGVLSVVAAGNAGDLYGAVGSPGSARKALTVAATDDGVDTVDGIKISVDAADSTYPATNSIAYDYRGNPADNVGQLVKLTQADNLDGCSALNGADAAAVAGKYAFLEWDDDDTTRRCGSVGRSARVKAAGALGAVFGSNAVRFSAGITGDPDIPVTLTNKTGADAIRSALTAGKTVTATFGFNYRAGTPNGSKIVDLPSTDKIASFTSRGGTPLDGYLKPDVGAPGLHTFSANSGTGNEGLDESGTSMATPHTAGVAALVKAAHPDWTAEELKAAIMNTASGVLTTDGHGAGTKYGVTRVGAGRVDALDAVQGEVVAFDASDPGAVGLGFGSVAVTGALTRTKTVKLENFGDAAQTYGVSYVSSQDVPGVTFTPSTTSVTVPAAGLAGPGTATFTVDMVVSSKAALRKTPDPTIELQQGDLDRDFLAEENGRLLLAPTGGGQTLVVPAAVAPRPASSMTAPATVNLLRGAHQIASGTLPLSGTGVSNGPLGEPDSVQGLVGGFQLQAESPALSACLPGQLDGCLHFPSEKGGDLQYVGAGVGNGLLGIALTTRGNVYTPAYNPTTSIPVGEVAFIVSIDTDGNGSPDREVDVTRYYADTDVYVAETYDVATGEVLDDQFLNSVPGSVDSNTVNTNAMVLPVSLAALGLPPNRSRISYTVTTVSLDDLTSTLDTVGPLTFDTAHPAVSVQPQLEDTLLSQDLPGTTLQVTGDGEGDDTDNLGLLLLHLHNTDGTKAQVVKVSTTLDPRLESYTPLAPSRLGTVSVDTGHWLRVGVAGRNGVPYGASGVLLAVTATSTANGGQVKVYTDGTDAPLTAVLNTRGAQRVGNLVEVPLTSGGFRVANILGRATVTLDVQGYFTKGVGGSTFVPVAPHRVLDTRKTGGALANGGSRDLVVPGAPAGATAVALQVTTVNPSGAGLLTAGPAASTVATTSNVVETRAVDTTTMVVSKLGPGGRVRFTSRGAATHVVVDVLGWYASSDGGAFVPFATPQKLFDTRNGFHVTKGQIAARAVRDVRAGGFAGVPASATAVLLNLTGLNAKLKTAFSAYPTPASGSAVPSVVDLNLPAGVVAPNLVVVPLGKDGAIRFRNASAPADLAAYVTGYYTG